MKLLFLAPEPFFQERGTPIAVRLALEVIADRFKRYPDEKRFLIDLVCYHEGTDPNIPGVTVNRINPGPIRAWLKNVSPGLTFKKLVCDLLFTWKAASQVLKNRNNQYQMIHAVEESVFIALLFKVLFKIPYIYDMDSSLAMQVTEKWHLLKPMFPLLRWLEKQAVKHSSAVAPVCDALGVIARQHGAKKTVVLRDISLLKESSQDKDQSIELKKELNIDPHMKIILYVGNLESYQGIDLLLESFARLSARAENWVLAVIGGSDSRLQYYRQRVESLQLSGRAFFAGPRPIDSLGVYMRQADILASPRIRGNNTPMKIYSYLHSGVAIIATKLPTHTQVLDDTVAILAEPTVDDFSAKLEALIKDSDSRSSISGNAYRLAEKNYTFEVFSRELNRLYDQLNISGPQAVVAPARPE